MAVMLWVFIGLTALMVRCGDCRGRQVRIMGLALNEGCTAGIEGLDCMMSGAKCETTGCKCKSADYDEYSFFGLSRCGAKPALTQAQIDAIECEFDEDCNRNYKKAICKSPSPGQKFSKCGCAQGSTIQGSECKPLNCWTSNKDCSSLGPNMECKETFLNSGIGKCMCKDDTTSLPPKPQIYFNGVCVDPNNVACDPNDITKQCPPVTSGSMVCTDMKCKCNNNYNAADKESFPASLFNNNGQMECKSTFFGDSCQVDNDCPRNSRCIRNGAIGLCGCKTYYRSTKTFCEQAVGTMCRASTECGPASLGNPTLTCTRVFPNERGICLCPRNFWWDMELKKCVSV